MPDAEIGDGIDGKGETGWGPCFGAILEYVPTSLVWFRIVYE